MRAVINANQTYFNDILLTACIAIVTISTFLAAVSLEPLRALITSVSLVTICAVTSGGSNDSHKICCHTHQNVPLGFIDTYYTYILGSISHWLKRKYEYYIFLILKSLTCDMENRCWIIQNVCLVAKACCHLTSDDVIVCYNIDCQATRIVIVTRHHALLLSRYISCI